MGLRDYSEYYPKGSRTRKENWSVQCGQSVTSEVEKNKWLGQYQNQKDKEQLLLIIVVI